MLMFSRWCGVVSSLAAGFVRMFYGSYLLSILLDDGVQQQPGAREAWLSQGLQLPDYNKFHFFFIFGLVPTTQCGPHG